MKIEIKSIVGSILFEYDCEENTVIKTLLKGLDSGADFRGADFRDADLSYTYLRGADLSGADLSYTDLRGADLRDADLRDADLSGANLSYTYLRGADLRGADLSGANLSGANLDFSVLSFSCKSRKPNTDERQRIQLTHHLLSWIYYSDNATEFEKSLFEFAKEYANRFHRDDVEKFK